MPRELFPPIARARELLTVPLICRTVSTDGFSSSPRGNSSKPF